MARIKNLQGQIKASAENARKAAESAAVAAKTLLEKAAGSSSKAAEIIASTDTLELSTPDPAKVEQAGKLITDLKESSDSLAIALASSLKAWEDSNQQIKAVAARGAELTSILNKELAAVKSMGEKLQLARAAAARAEAAVNTAKADWEKWTSSFETASQGSQPSATVVANN